MAGFDVDSHDGVDAELFVEDACDEPLGALKERLGGGEIFDSSFGIAKPGSTGKNVSWIKGLGFEWKFRLFPMSEWRARSN